MRYTPHTEKEVSLMLRKLGLGSIDELFSDIPENLRAKTFNVGRGLSEFEALKELKELAGKNKTGIISFTGGGFYDHFIPAAVDAIASLPGFYTAYTPYQSECSQGTLQAIYEYQSAMCALTDMEVSNASVYDGGTALAEAVLIAVRKTGRRKVAIDGGVNPLYRQIVKTYLSRTDCSMVTAPARGYSCDAGKFMSLLDEDTAAVVVQNPNFYGTIRDYADIVSAAHELGAVAVGSFYPVSLGILKSPGEMGFDIATGDGQSLGNPLNFGGPYLGFMTSSKKYLRNLPGRIVGATIDAKGRRAFVLTLQAREQHIRRERASSNICSNQNLCALRALVFLSLAGRNGIVKLAEANRNASEYAKSLITGVPGVKAVNDGETFNEFVAELPCNAKRVYLKMKGKGFSAGIPLGGIDENGENKLLLCFTEKSTKSDIEKFASALEGCCK